MKPSRGMIYNSDVAYDKEMDHDCATEMLQKVEETARPRNDGGPVSVAQGPSSLKLALVLVLVLVIGSGVAMIAVFSDSADDITPVPTPMPSNVPTPMRKFTKFTMVNATARCNDGSPPVFYFSASPFPGSPWLVGLESGGQCSDAASCKARRSWGFRLTSSTTTEESLDIYGHFSGDGAVNEMASFNKVYVHYCSSDGWHGDAIDPFKGAVQGMRYFQGARIITQVFELLQNGNPELPLPLLEQDAKVVFSGYSAGARGAMVNGDRIRKMVPNLRLILDSPYYVITDNPGSVLVPETQGVYENFVNQTLLAVENKVASWHDLFGEFRMPNVQTPYFLMADQLDSYQYPNLAGADFPEKTVKNLIELDPKDSKSFIYSPRIGSHATMLSQNGGVGLCRPISNAFVREFVGGAFPDSFFNDTFGESRKDIESNQNKS